MTAPETLDAAAVQIVTPVLDNYCVEGPEDPARDVVAALARAGRLHDPAEVAALRAVAKAAVDMRAVGSLEDERWPPTRALRDALRSLDALRPVDGRYSGRDTLLALRATIAHEMATRERVLRARLDEMDVAAGNVLDSPVVDGRTSVRPEYIDQLRDVMAKPLDEVTTPPASPRGEDMDRLHRVVGDYFAAIDGSTRTAKWDAALTRLRAAYGGSAWHGSPAHRQKILDELDVVPQPADETEDQGREGCAYHGIIVHGCSRCAEQSPKKERPVRLPLDLLVAAVRASWDDETGYTNGADFDPRNPARGQCVTSALVMRDYLGGDLRKAYVSSGGGPEETHYYNTLPDRTLVDVTREQYRYPVTLREVDGMWAEWALTDDETRERYQRLGRKVRSILDQGRPVKNEADA